MDRLPEALAQGLRDADGPRALVPPEVDQAVLGSAKSHFVGRAQRRRAGGFRLLGLGARQWGGAVAAAAAAVAVGLLVFVFVDGLRDDTQRMLADLRDGAAQPMPLGPGSPMELAWDVDRSGTLDVLDVMILAKIKQRGDRGVADDVLADLERRIVSLDRVVSVVPGPMGDGARVALAQDAAQRLAAWQAGAWQGGAWQGGAWQGGAWQGGAG